MFNVRELIGIGTILELWTECLMIINQSTWLIFNLFIRTNVKTKFIVRQKIVFLWVFLGGHIRIWNGYV